MPNRLIFCLTTGRSGTGYLARVLNVTPRSYALHEPWPNFVDMLHASDDEKREWLLETKLPYIFKQVEPDWIDNYMETSHMFSDFAKLFAEMGVSYDAIRLRRDLHCVAVSAWRMNYIPVRTPNMRRYFDMPNFEHEKLTDYQLCYWYALEKDRRADLAQKYVTGNIYDTEISKIIYEPSYLSLLSQMGLESPNEEAYHKTCVLQINKSQRKALPPGDLLEQELEMRKIWEESYALAAT